MSTMSSAACLASCPNTAYLPVKGSMRPITTSFTLGGVGAGGAVIYYNPIPIATTTTTTARTIARVLVATPFTNPIFIPQ